MGFKRKVNNLMKIFKYNTKINYLFFYDFKSAPFLFIENGDKRPRAFYVTLNLFLSFTMVVFMLGVFTHTVQAEPLRVINVVEGDVWRYFKGEKKPKSKWNHIGFDDSGWHSGPSGFGYGDSNNNTVLDDMQGKYTSVCVRREFTVDNPNAITRMTLTIDSDGAFIAYLNGLKVIQSKVKMNEELDISGFAHELFPGTNVLCIQAFNDKIDSDDFTFIPRFKLVEE